MTTATRKPTKARKPAPLPQDVTVECITSPTYQGGKGLVVLNGSHYLLCCHGATSRDGYRLTKLSDMTAYDVDTADGYPRCDCPDFETRRSRHDGDWCKHGFALIQLRKLGAI